MGIDILSMLVFFMKNTNQKEEWDRFKTCGISGNVVRDSDWRPASEVMSEETYLDSLYDNALMKSAMHDDDIGVTLDGLDNMNSDEDNEALQYEFQHVDDDGYEDEDDD
jgi:hypothetical protein